MAVVPPPVMGKIAGFVIIRNGTERLEFATPEEMAAEVKRAQEIERAFWEGVRESGKGSCTSAEYAAANIPADEYRTLMRRDDNGVVEEDHHGADYSGRTKIGDPYIKKFCHSCGGDPCWFPYEESSKNYPYECEACTDRDIDSDHQPYDGSQEREH